MAKYRARVNQIAQTLNPRSVKIIADYEINPAEYQKADTIEGALEALVHQWETLLGYTLVEGSSGTSYDNSEPGVTCTVVEKP